MKIKKSHLKELIRQAIKELKFKSQDDFEKYDKKHNMRPDTKVNIAGKDTTVGQAVDVGGPAHPNVKKGEPKKDEPKKEPSKPKVVAPMDNPYDNTEKDDLQTFNVFVDGHDKPMKVKASDEKSAKHQAHQMIQNNKVKISAVEPAGVGGPAHADIPTRDKAPDGGHLNAKQASDDIEKQTMDAAKKANQKMEIDVLNKKAEEGNGELIDTEYNGTVVWDQGDPDEDTFFAIDGDGETVELDYSDIIRFQNDGEDESMLKNVQGLGDKEDTMQQPFFKISYTDSEGREKTDSMRAKTPEEAKKDFENMNKGRGFKVVKVQKESVKESIVVEKFGRRFTVKEVRLWMKTLEENRYKKTYNSDCRRVAWLVNHIGEDIQNMPKSMAKKWSKAAYGRERYLAREFLKSQKQTMAEHRLRKLIRKVIIKEIRGTNEKKKKL